MTITAKSDDLVRLNDPFRGSGNRFVEEPGDLLDLRALWELVRSQGRLALSIFCTTILVAVLYLLVVPPVYTGVSVIHIDPRQQRVTASQSVLSGIGADAAAVESQVELIKSTTVAGTVIDQLGLLEDPEFSAPSLIGYVKRLILPKWGTDDAAAAEKLRNKVIVRFQDQLSVRRRGLTYIIEVKFDSVDPKKSARIANAIADAYLDDQLSLRTDAATSASNWLTGRMEELREKVRLSERAVANFKAENKIVDVGSAGSGNTLSNRQLVELNQQLILARARSAEAKAKYDQVLSVTRENVDPGSLPDALNSDVITRLRVQYSAVARVESEYSATYGSGHPSLKNIRNQLARLRQEIKQELQRILASSKNEYEIAKSRVDSLTSSLEGLEAQSADLNQARVKLGELEREAEANRDLFEQFLARAKETSEERNLKTSDARIVARAIVPVEPTSPQKLAVLIIAIVAGSGLAFSGAYVRHKMERGYRSKSELERDTGVPCLGVCPALDPRELKRRPVRRSAAKRSTPALLSRLADLGRRRQRVTVQDALGRLTLDKPDTDFSEAIRSIRLGLEAEADDSSKKIVLVSSALPQEGKSTIAVNLARALAKSGRFTLLIDLDAKAQTLSRLIGSSNASGLSEVLSGRTALEDAIIFDKDCGLLFLPVGSIRSRRDQADMFVNIQLEEFLAKHRDDFDCIIIDGPPILGTADGRFLYRYADSGLFVVEWGVTHHNAVLTAMGELGPMRRKIAGTVLNKADPRSIDNYPYN